MANTRGPTGTVLGTDEHYVTALLAKLTLDLGRKFTRRQAAAWLREHNRLPAHHGQRITKWVEAMLQQLDRSPGVQPVRGEARYVVDPLVARQYMAQRTWRMALPSVDIISARILLAALTGQSQLPPTLYRLRLRLRTALEALD